MRQKLCLGFLCLVCMSANAGQVGENTEVNRELLLTTDEADKCTEAIIEMAMPLWPKSALRSGTTGWTVVRYDLNGSGRAQNATVYSAVPEQVFDQSSLFSIKLSKFKAGASRQGCKALIVFSNK